MQELNIKLVEVIRLKVKTDIESVLDKTRLMANAEEQSLKQKMKSKSLQKHFFKDDLNFILFGIFSEDNGNLKPKLVNYNDKYLPRIEYPKKNLTNY